MQEQSLQNNRWIKWMGLVFVMAVLLFQNSIPVKAETVPTILKEYETNISAEGKEQIHFTVPNAPCRIMMQTVTTGGSVTVGNLYYKNTTGQYELFPQYGVCENNVRDVNAATDYYWELAAGTASVEVCARVTAVSLADDMEPNDTMSQAMEIGLDTSYQASLTVGDVDYYKYTPTTSVPVSFRTLNADTSGTLMLRVYRDQTLIKEFDQSQPVPFFQGHTYYIAVSSKNPNETKDSYCMRLEKADSCSFDLVSASAVPGQNYDGTAKKPSVTLTETINQVLLTEGKDYTLSYSNNINIGTATITVNGIGMFAGATKNVTFSIALDDKDLSRATVSAIGNYTYTGSYCTPNPTVSYQGTILRNGIDYILTYSNNVSAGTASVTIIGRGNYKGSKTVSFTISGISIYNANVSSIPTQPYTGNAVMPSVVLTYAGQNLVSDRDYTLIYVNNITVGTASIIINGKGNFSGSKTINFTIGNVNLADSQITPIPDQIYTGSVIRPGITVSYNGRTLVLNQDYTIVYPMNAITIGTYTITVMGKGKCIGNKTVSFRIVDGRQDIGVCAGISYIKPQVYTGSEIRPKVEVYAAGNKLAKNIDYTLSYSSNTSVGKAKVTVKGIGKYTGTLTTSFRIKPRKLTLTSGRWTGKNQITLRWKKLAGVSGYEVYRSTNANTGFKKIGYSTKTSAVNRKLRSNQTYYYKVRGYKKVGDIFYYGTFDKIKVNKRQ